MTINSTAFEKQITRIHQLIENKNAVVTWNDIIPDPDNPEQSRQIDFTIRENGCLTLGECRIRKRPQDVNWIEHLIGRKLSLKADTVIAVSNSGFTIGAIKKARAYGIFLRDLATLTDQEIIEWGNQVKATSYYLKIEDLKIQLIHLGAALAEGEYQKIGKSFYANKPLLPLILQALSHKIDPHKIGTVSGHIENAEIDVNGLTLGGYSVPRIRINCRFHIVSDNISAPCVRVYQSSNYSNNYKIATIEHINLGDTEVIQEHDKARMIIDYSNLKIPDSSIFLYANFDFKRIVNCRVEDIGRYAFPISFKKMMCSLSIKSVATDSNT